MLDKLIYVLAGLTVLAFLLTIFYKGNSVKTCLLFILTLLPLMDLKITNETWGGFKVFDFICFYSLVFLLTDFTSSDFKGRYKGYFVLFVLFVLVVLLGGLASEFPGRTYLNVVKMLPVFIFGRFLILACYQDAIFHNRAINALKISYLTALSFLALQWVIGLRFTFYPALSPNTIDPIFHLIRYPGIFYDSQASGQYLAMGSFLFLYIDKDATLKTRWLNYGVFALAVIGISIAGSRAAFGGFIMGAAVAFFMAAKNYRIHGVVFILIAYFAFTAVTIHNGVFDRSKNLSEDFIFRQSVWKKAFEISKQHPYLGIGTNNYQNYVMRHAQDQYLEVEDGQLVYFDQPENGYLKIMAELGFIGFTLFVMFLISPLLQGFTAFVKEKADKRIAFLIAGLLCWAIAFNTVYSIYDYRILIMVAGPIVLILTYPKTEPGYERA
jgi:O-antigen ligase